MFIKSIMFYFAAACVLLSGCIPESEDDSSPLIGSWSYSDGVMTFNDDGTYAYVPESGDGKSENGYWFDNGTSVTLEQDFESADSGSGSLSTTMTYAVLNNQFFLGDVYFTVDGADETNRQTWEATYQEITQKTSAQKSYEVSLTVHSKVEVVDNELIWTNEVTEVTTEDGQETARKMGKAIASGPVRIENSSIYFTCLNIEANNFEDIGTEFCNSQDEMLFGNLLTPDILNAINYQYLYL